MYIVDLTIEEGLAEKYFSFFIKPYIPTKKNIYLIGQNILEISNFIFKSE